jgi:hypothetical protein
VSLFSELLEQAGLDPQDLEPDEIRALCDDQVFRMVCDYCARSRGWTPPPRATFDADEMGLDPERNF